MRTILRTTALPLAILALGACQRPVDVYTEAPAPTGEIQPVIVATGGDAIPAQTQIQASLDETLSTNESEVNQRFTMTLQTPVLNAERETVIPAGARITGIITGLRESADVATPAIIRLAFESISWDGQTAPLSAEVVEANPQTEGQQTEDVLRGAAAGAAAGAVLGAIIGRDVEGAAVGAALGAGAGTAISLGTSNQTARLEAGSTLTLRLLEPVPVR